MGLHTLRSIPYGTKRDVWHFRTSADTQQLCSFICQYATSLFSYVMFILFLPGDCSLYILHYLDRLRCHYFYHRKTRMAHRSKRCDLRIGFFLVFQWIIAKIHPSDCHFIIGYFLIWRTRMANVPLLYTCQYFMGRAS